MTEQLKQIIKDQLINLPKETQDVINNTSWEKIIEKIGKKYLLSEDEINDLQIETAIILLGLVDPDLYSSNIENEMKISKNLAEKIEKEVSEEIFSQIHDKVIEKIKENIKDKKWSWKQNINFILSGGNYASLLEKPGTTNELDSPQKDKTPTNYSKIENLKNNFTI